MAGLANVGRDGPPESVAVALGRAIKRARKARGIRSQVELAAMTGEGESVIAKAETGTRVPTREVLDAIVSALEIKGTDLATLEEIWWLARNQENPEESRTVPWFETEAQAHTLWYWALALVPGIAQTEDYARELFNAWGHDEATIDELVRRRIERQSVIHGPNNPDVTIVLWERILDTLIVPEGVMVGQIDRLLELSERRNVHVQVLPLTGHPSPGLGGAISLAKIDIEEVVLIEASEDYVTSDPVRVRNVAGTFSIIRSDALPRAASRAKLIEAREKWS